MTAINECLDEMRALEDALRGAEFVWADHTAPLVRAGRTAACQCIAYKMHRAIADALGVAA